MPPQPPASARPACRTDAAARSPATRSLHFLFDKHFSKAVQIVDQGGVFGFTGERSGRRVFQVKGRGSSDAYTVVPASYCACHNFFFDVASKSEALYVSERRPACMPEMRAPCRARSPPMPSRPRCAARRPPPRTQCKHQLAVSLAEALGKTRNTTVSDLAVAEVLQS